MYMRPFEKHRKYYLLFSGTHFYQFLSSKHMDPPFGFFFTEQKNDQKMYFFLAMFVGEKAISVCVLQLKLAKFMHFDLCA